MKDHARALAEFNVALALRPDFAEAHLQRALLHYGQGRWQAAREDFSSFLRRQPDDLPALRLRADCSLWLLDYLAAAADYRRWSRLDRAARKEKPP